jgi:D-alanyl-D-alanine carboxypeptidase
MKNYFKLLTLGSVLLLASTIFAGDQLDIELQGDVNRLYSQFSDSPAFSAIQLSVLLPGESQPRDYVVGTQSAENRSIPATSSMLTQYGSITKEFTSALIIQYMSDHHSALTLKTRLGALFQDKFPPQGDWPAAWKTVTVEQLMHMTSGIADYTPPITSVNPYPQYTLNDLVEQMAVEQNTRGCIADNGCFIPAGVKYFYSNTNYIILGLLVERLYRDDYAKVLNRKILQKLQAHHNYVYYKLNYSHFTLARMLNGYWDDIQLPYLNPQQNVTDFNLTLEATAGGMTGNTHALINLIYNFFNEKILSPEETKMIKQTGFVHVDTGIPVAPTELKSECASGCYGLGISYLYNSTYGDIYTYTGGTLGFSTTYIWLPKYFTR